MTKKLNSILLIDDDAATNFIHKKLINDVGCAKEVIAVQSGQEALDFLNVRANGPDQKLDLIFLDINMPAMNGWEFLERYKKLETGKQARAVLIMLTTSLNPDDMENASKIDEINGFENKPLTEEKLIKTLETHFSNLQIT